MSTPSKPVDGVVKSPTGAESPTTVRPLDMDDEDVQEMGTLGGETTAAVNPAVVEEGAPPKPPRPLSPQQQSENTLKEAFPSIDGTVIKAVLMASGGRVEPAFNALLGMSDPDAVIEPTPPPQPPRPTARGGATSQSQLEADEQYARRLAQQYENPAYGQRGAPRGRPQPPPMSNEEERSFIDDDLPILRENIKKGFLETQTKVSGWFADLKKKIDGDDDDPTMGPPQGYKRGEGRQSGDYNRYDADPQVLSDDFAGIQLKSDSPPPRPNRPLANPDLFKPTPAIPKSSDGRKVAFQSQPEDMDLYRTSPKLGATDSSAAATSKTSKWQPMSAVDPSPEASTFNDPFSLGDSEDEKESKERIGGEIKTEDAERLKKAAAEAMAENISEPARKPEAAETSGTKDKIAEETLAKS